MVRPVTALNECVAKKPSRIDTQTWKLIVSAYPILCRNLREIPLKCDEKQFRVVTQMIKDKELSYSVTLSVMDTALYDIVSQTSTLWKKFEYKKECRVVKNGIPQDSFAQEMAGFFKFSDAMNELFTITKSKMYFIGRLQCLHGVTRWSVMDHFLLRFGALVYSKFPKNCETNIYHFYKIGLRVINKDRTNVVSIKTSRKCDKCFLELPDCACNTIVEMFNRTNWQLNKLDIMEWLTCDILMDIMRAKVEAKVNALHVNNLKKHQLPLLEKWMDTTIYSWMKQICEPGYDSTSRITKSELFYIMKKLNLCLYKSFTILRLAQLFDMVFDYPDTKPAIEDLVSAYPNSNLCDADLQIVSLSLSSKESYQTLNSVPRNSLLSIYLTYKNILFKVDPSGLLFEKFQKFLK